MRAVTKGPNSHWFGYYDKLQFDVSGRYALGMEVQFENRAPEPDDEIGIGLIDLANGDKWTEIGRTNAWCWQQGCMLQWRPGFPDEVIWNVRDKDRFLCKILNIKNGLSKTLPMAIYAISPNGETAVCSDFRRIQDMRPGYGYAGVADPNKNILAPDDEGIWSQNLDTGEAVLLASIAEVASIDYPHGDLNKAKHYFNHLLISPDGRRTIFLHRWRFGSGPFHTRMLSIGLNGRDLRVIDDWGKTSHFVWRNNSQILAWSWHPSFGNAFYVYGDGDGFIEPVGLEKMKVNGHCTYFPLSKSDEWILNDSYPKYNDGQRVHELYLFNPRTNKRIEIAEIYAPTTHKDDSRCDLHPRGNPEGTRIMVDSAHNGNRQMYLFDLE